MATRTYGATSPSPAVKIGAHHLAYLRALAEGVAQRPAAVRYLGLDPRDGAVVLRRVHSATVDRVRALARRRGDTGWRLIGLSIRLQDGGEQPPSIDDWASERSLDGFSQADLLVLHAEAFPPARRAQRNGRLRARQLQLLQSLAQVAAEIALPHHRLDAWFPEHLCRSLVASGVLLLSDLQAMVQAGGRWWRSIPNIGVGKAERLAQQLEVLLPGSTAARRSSALAQRGRSLAAAITTALIDRHAPPSPAAGRADLNRLGITGFDEVCGEVLVQDQQTDAAAVRVWIGQRAGSAATAKAYRRELGRFLLFLELRGRTLGDCDAGDCRAYMALLQDVPPDWSAKRTAPLEHDAWSPFAGPLSVRSQRQAIAVVGSCFAWLVAARCLVANPWALVDRRPGGDHGTEEPDCRAICQDTWPALCDSLERLAPGVPAAQRMVFLLQFLGATGLRATELLEARLGDLQRQHGKLLLRVRGNGDRQRLIPVAGQAERSLASYLASRGLDLGAIEAQPSAPLLASLTTTTAALTYRSLYGSMKTWLNKAIDGSALSWADKVAAARASPQWLRHTCGTRALERGVPLDVVGQLLGHADPRSTARYQRANVERVIDEVEKAFG